jgi:hypothetical protein
MTLLQAILAHDLAVRAFCSRMAYLVAETALASELSGLGTFGFSVTFFATVEAGTRFLSRLSTVTSKVALLR